MTDKEVLERAADALEIPSLGSQGRYVENALAARLREIAARLDRPCPYVIVADEGTQHCALAERDAKDAERFRKLGEWVAFGNWSVGEHEKKDAWSGTNDYYIDDLDDLRQSIDQERAVNARAAKKEEK